MFVIADSGDKKREARTVSSNRTRVTIKDMRILALTLLLACNSSPKTATVEATGSAVVAAKPIDAPVADATAIPADAGRPVPMSGDDMIGMLNMDHFLDPMGTFQVLYWNPGNLQLVFLSNVPTDTSDDVKLMATNLVTKEVELLIKAGYNPRVEHANVSLDVLILGKSVTGAQTHKNLGGALYFWSDDKVSWQPVTN